jgi:hypothetical protein
LRAGEKDFEGGKYQFNQQGRCASTYDLRAGEKDFEGGKYQFNQQGTEYRVSIVDKSFCLLK